MSRSLKSHFQISFVFSSGKISEGEYSELDFGNVNKHFMFCTTAIAGLTTYTIYPLTWYVYFFLFDRCLVLKWLLCYRFSFYIVTGSILLAGMIIYTNALKIKGGNYQWSYVLVWLGGALFGVNLVCEISL